MNRLLLSRLLHEALLEDARRSLPNECCGLLGGQGEQATRIFPATNRLASPTAYDIAVPELIALFRRLRAEKLELVGIYHSHPTGDNLPSARDLERAFYPGAAYVIVSPRADARAPVRAFLIRDDEVVELTVEIG
ncbi:MAG: Mov34/MPN/PAD-1 family protein [Candidatus Acidiferrales bacterium]